MVIFGFSFMNSCTILVMKGPSPPVKPFQYDRVTAGPLYEPLKVVLGAAPAPPAASEADLPPPQAARVSPAAAAPLRPSRARRETPLELMGSFILRSWFREVLGPVRVRWPLGCVRGRSAR